MSRRRATTQHGEWLSLIDVSGVFLTPGVLRETFPHGLDEDDPERARRLRLAFAEWSADPSLHDALVRHCVRELLGYAPESIAAGPAIGASLTAELPAHRVTLRPDLVLRHPDGVGEPLPLLVFPPGTPLARSLGERGLQASPQERMRLLLRQSSAQASCGLVTNGEAWTLVHAPREGTASFAGWNIPDMLDERLTLRAFCSLLSQQRVLGSPDGERLADLLARSASDETEVTETLGLQVRRAVELLVTALDRADRARGGALTAAVRELERHEEAPRTIYEASVAFAMRLVFLLAAEARGLILPASELWQEAYAVAPLFPALQRAADLTGDEALDHRHDAYSRLLATFRAVHGGVGHESLRLPGYGGGLFDPARYPFLERDGVGEPVTVSNRVLLRMLESLLVLDGRPLSYRALSVEQIGHVYEGLLDHTALRASEGPVLGLVGKRGAEPEVDLARLEARAAEGDDALVTYLHEVTSKSEAALRKLLESVPDALRRQRLETACERDAALVARVEPLLGVVRDDAYGTPVVIPHDAVFVTESDERAKSGTHYTPPALTGEIVEHTLNGCCFDGCRDDLPEGEWTIRRPGELLALRVADIACGSGAFLVAACRYLAARLCESWDAYSGEQPEGLPADPEERELRARRMVAERCLYGVDKNPIAVEMAKLSLW